MFWPASKFKITTSQGITYLDAVSGASRNDKLVIKNVEAIEFSDKTVSLEIAYMLLNTPGKDNYDVAPGIDSVVYNGLVENYVVATGVNGMEVSGANYSQSSN